LESQEDFGSRIDRFEYLFTFVRVLGRVQALNSLWSMALLNVCPSGIRLSLAGFELE
jgi:hypothetical protein